MKNIYRFSVALFAVFALSLVAFAQSGTYALKNASIVTVSGSTISSGTIVIRNGLIESVGTSVSIPADAEEIDAKGLTIYPGFIDANTRLGFDAPSNAVGAQDKSNSKYSPVLRASADVMDMLKAGEKQFTSHRNAGITTVVTSPNNRIFNGRSAVINLAGETVSAMVLKPHFAQHIAYRTQGRGEFPSSLMGTFAAMREMFSDAKRLDLIKQMYAKNPKGLPRPESDPDLEALIPVVRGEMPVVIYANTEREIIRGLSIAKEFNLKVIIAGGREAAKTASRLKAQDVPVLLSLDFPMVTAARDKNADPESLQTLRMRVEAPKAAAKLKAAGVKFAFQSGSLKSIKDFVKHAGVAVENGLSKTDAIQAMTLGSAQILGLDAQLGSIETGKIANLVVMDGDVFAKDSAVTHVFVDGKLFKQPKKKKTPAKKASAGGTTATSVKAGGTWKITIDSPVGAIPVTLELEQRDKSLSGKMISEQLGSSEIRNGVVTDDGFTFDVTVQFQGQDLDLNINGVITGDKVEGSVGTAQGPATFSGERSPSE